MKNLLRRYLFEGDILKLMGIVVLAKPLGLVVQMLLANYFGAGEKYDAYALALFLVSYVGSVVGRVYTSVVIPYTIKLRRELDPAAILRFQNAVILLFTVPAALYTLLLMTRGDPIIGLAGPELPQATRGYAVDMLRAMALPGMLLLQVAMLKAILNLNEHYRLPTAMPVVNSVAMFVAVVAFHERYGIWSVPLGFGFSNLLQVMVLAWSAGRKGYLSLARPALPKGALGRIWSLGWMMLVSQSIITLYQFVDKMFATGLEAGSISSISYSMTLLNFGTQMFGFTLVMVMFTRMSQMLSEERIAELNHYVRDNTRRVVRIVVPVSLAMSFAAVELIRVLYQRGAFTPEDTARTASALAIYILGLPGLITNNILTRIFHSLQRMREKILLALQYLVTNVIGNLILVHRFGVAGLATATVITINLHLFLSFWVLQRYRMGLDARGLAVIVFRHYLIAAATAAGFILLGGAALAERTADPSTLPGAIVVGTVKGLLILGGYFLLFALQDRLRKAFAGRAS